MLYEVEGHLIELGDGHLMPVYQKNCPLFYRFVPFLAELENQITPPPICQKIKNI